MGVPKVENGIRFPSRRRCHKKTSANLEDVLTDDLAEDEFNPIIRQFAEFISR